MEVDGFKITASAGAGRASGGFSCGPTFSRVRARREAHTRDDGQAIVAGETDPQQLAELAKRRLRSRIPALRQALDGRVTAHHRFLLRTLFGHLEFLEQQIRDLDHRIEEAVGPFARQIDRLMTTSGVQRRTAENVLAELGPDMTVFPSASDPPPQFAVVSSIPGLPEPSRRLPLMPGKDDSRSVGPRGERSPPPR